jgi:hypothetical protein
MFYLLLLILIALLVVSVMSYNALRAKVGLIHQLINVE